MHSLAMIFAVNKWKSKKWWLKLKNEGYLGCVIGNLGQMGLLCEVFRDPVLSIFLPSSLKVKVFFFLIIS